MLKAFPYIKHVHPCQARSQKEDGGRGGRGGGRGAPLLFFENRMKCPDFGQKGPNCVHPLVESPVQNVVLKVSRRKSSRNFPCRAFLLVYLTKSFLKRPNSIKPPMYLKISGYKPACVNRLHAFFYKQRFFSTQPQCCLTF